MAAGMLLGIEVAVRRGGLKISTNQDTLLSHYRPSSRSCALDGRISCRYGQGIAGDKEFMRTYLVNSEH